MNIQRIYHRYLAPLCLTAGLLFLAACKDTPDYVIDKAEMAELIADINEANIIVETNVAKYPSDSTKQLLKQSIFAKHNVTSEQFDTSLNWYGHNLELYAKIHDEAIEILEEKQKHLQDEARKSGIQIVAAGDSVNLWNAPAYHLFKPEITGKSSTPMVERENLERPDAMVS